MKSKRQKQIEALERWEERLAFVSGPAENKRSDKTQQYWDGRKTVAVKEIERLREILGGVARGLG